MLNILWYRLSNAVRYEQSFADYYLATPVTCKALGMACRTALFNPLVASIKNRGKVIF